VSRPVDPEARRREAMSRVRSTGAQGGRIDPHRAIATIDLHRRDVILAAACFAVATLLYALALPWLGRLWTAAFEALSAPLGMGGAVGQRVTSIASLTQVAVPYFVAQASAPSRTEWWITLVVTVVVVLCTIPMRSRTLPLAYALRFAAAIQATALLFFAVAPARFPYDLAGYVSGMMLVGAMLIGIVPLVLALTFYLIDVGWTRKVALTVLVMTHLAVLVPLQYALQSVVIVHASLIVLPLCFVMFGLLPEIMVLVALFGWGMSWRPGRARGTRQ
jgi:hypothetical protein